MSISLRPYQQECVDVIDRVNPGSYLIVLFTGAGKTVIFSHIKRRGRVLLLSHREELVNQPKKYYDCSFGVERAEESSHGEDVVSASVQTLIHRLDKFKPDDFDIIITDEAHHATAPSYQKIYDYFTPRLHLGFTATPNRADKVKLGKVFSEVIYEHDIKWGISNQFLSDIRCVRVDIGYDLKKVKLSMGDFKQNELETAVDITECNNAIAKVYKTMAKGPTLIFATSVEHAHNIAAAIPGAEVISGATPNRSEVLDRFREGKTPVIVNCMVLTEGTDLPMVQTVMMCRPTTNISLYCQMVGRGTRLYPGKKELCLIDCVGVSKLPLCTAPMLFNLDPEEAKTAGCDNMLLSQMEGKIDDYKEHVVFTDPDGWKVNTKLIQLFEENGGYDTHNVGYTICANKDMVCSVGDGVYIRLRAEDATGNTDFLISKWEEALFWKKKIPMQEALDLVYETLKKDYSKAQSLWDKEAVARWGDAPATKPQKSFIKSLYNETKEILPNIKGITKYQACCMINRMLEKKRSAG